MSYKKFEQICNECDRKTEHYITETDESHVFVKCNECGKGREYLKGQYGYKY